MTRYRDRHQRLASFFLAPIDKDTPFHPYSRLRTMHKYLKGGEKTLAKFAKGHGCVSKMKDFLYKFIKRLRTGANKDA
jgi:hypothetical protein